MRFEAFIASRYLRGKRKSRFVSLITLISVAGVAVGVMALIVVMSVMTGFDNEFRSAIMGNRAHLTIINYAGAEMDDYEAVIDEVEALCPEVLASSPFIEVPAVLKTRRSYSGNQDVSFVYVIGVDTERETGVTNLAENLTDENGRTMGSGKLPGYKEIVPGCHVATTLEVREGDDIGILTPRMRPGALSMSPASMWVKVSGVSESQYYEFDAIQAYVTLDTARKLKGQEGVDGVRCKLKEPFKAEQVAARVTEKLGYRTITWYESQQAFFEALEQEKVVMFIILVFIILVAAFNITSTLIMVVMEKRRDIGILRTIGVSGGQILRLFVLEGLYIGLVGTFVGVAAGTVLAFNLNSVANVIARMLGVDLFNSLIYGFEGIPVAVMWGDVAWITFSAVILTFLSTLYPAWSAARVDPVDALRYE